MMIHNGKGREQAAGSTVCRRFGSILLGVMALLTPSKVVAQVPAIARTIEPRWPLQRTAEEAGHCVVVCPPLLRDSLQPWIDLREREGLAITLIDSQPSAALLQEAIRAAADDDVRYVMLVGDTPTVGQGCDASIQVPTHYVPTRITERWGSTPDAASDGAFGDLDGDGHVDVAVGRLPVDSPEALQGLVTRILAYEHSVDFGAWRGEVQLTGGVGGFGTFIDAAIESVTRTLVTSVLPAECKTTVAYGSPGHLFFPDDRPFTEEVLARYQRGARFWVYAGHGWIDSLDRVPRTPSGEAVLDTSSVNRLSRPDGVAPIALMLACYTGAFDAPQESLAERMLLEPAGPVAVFAGSRVTMPYGNTVAAVGLIDGVYRQRVDRLGDAWLATQRTLQRSDDEDPSSLRLLIDSLAALVSPAGTTLAEERREHAATYNLLGDPTLCLHHPDTVTLSAPSGIGPGETMVVELTSPIDGELRLSCDRPLGSVTEGDPNQTTIATICAPVVADQLGRHHLVLPAEVRGPIIIRALVEGPASWATAATRTLVHSN